MTTDNLTARYRAAAARMREMEAAADLDRLDSTHITSPGYTNFANLTEQISEGQRRGRCLAMLPLGWSDLIRASRNLLLPLLAAGDALARTIECDEASLKTYDLAASDYSEQHSRNLAALAALTDALERECGGAA